MSEAYLFAQSQAATPTAAIAGALRAAGLGPRALAEIVWIGSAEPELPGGCPLVQLPEGARQSHFVLQALARRFEGGERGLLAFGQSGPAGADCLLLGGPAAVGRLNLLPLYRLHPAPALPGEPPAALEAAESFRLALTPPPPPEEPTPEDAPPLIISPAMPPPLPPAPPEPPEIQTLLAEEGDAPFFPAAARLPAAPGLAGLRALLAALPPESWGAWSTPLAHGGLLTLLERL